MKNLLIILGVGLLSAVLPFGKAMSWGSSFSPASFSTIAATSDSGGGGASWNSPASYGWKQGNGGSWSRLSDVQRAAAIINSSALVSVNTVPFAKIYGAFSSTSALRSETNDLGTFKGVGKVSQTLTFKDVTTTTPALDFGKVTTKVYQDTRTKETVTTAVSQVMTPTGSSAADTSTGSKPLVKLSRDSVIPEKSGTAFQDKLNSLQNSPGEKFMVFGKEGDPVKASELSDNLGSINFPELMQAAMTSSQRPVQLSAGKIQGMHLETYTLTQKEFKDTETRVLDTAERTIETTVRDRYIPSTTSTVRLLTGISFGVEEIEKKTDEVVVQPVPSGPGKPSTGGSSADSSSGSGRFKITTTDYNGNTRLFNQLPDDQVNINPDGSLKVPSNSLPKVGNFEIVDTDTGKTYEGQMGTPEEIKKWTDDYTKGSSSGNSEKSSASTGKTGGTQGSSGGSESSSGSDGWGGFSTGDDLQDQRKGVGKYGK